MKKSFFLPIAALSAIFFFAACSDDKDDPPPSPPPPPITQPILPQLACNYLQVPAGGFCWEVDGISSTSELMGTRLYCAKGSETLGPGTLVDECPDSADLECPHSEDGVETKGYYYGDLALGIEALYGGCPLIGDDSSIACEMRAPTGLGGGACMELYDIPSYRLDEMKAHCTSGDFGFGFLGAGTLKDKCPDDAVYDCPIPSAMYDGFEGKSYYYGEYGEIANGTCPDPDDDGDYEWEWEL